MKNFRNYDDGRVTLIRKIQNIENSQNIMLSCVCRTLSLVSTGYEKVQLAQSTQVRRLQRACNKNYFCSLGRSQSGHAMLSPFFQPCYSTVLNEKSNYLLPTFSRCAAVNYYSVTVPQKLEFCEFQLHCIEFNVPGTNFSIKQLRGKNALLQNQTRSTLS